MPDLCYIIRCKCGQMKMVLHEDCKEAVIRELSRAAENGNSVEYKDYETIKPDEWHRLCNCIDEQLKLFEV